MLYAARYPERVARLALITAIPWALGWPATVEDRLAAARLRAGEPWFDAAYAAFEAAWTGRAPEDDDMEAYAPFFYGRWDATARAHFAADEEQCNEEAGEVYGSEGAYDPPATRAALAALDVPVLVHAGELDGGPRPGLARRVADLFPRGELFVQPGAGHYPWLDDPGTFVRRVGDFFAEG
jgi:pimeloyl-ACP methyl ester carboxylesterase